MPNNYNRRYTPLEVITIIKYLRPDAIESYVSSLLGETKHKSYYYMPRTNLETHARSRWFGRPTMFFYGNEYKDPSDLVEMFATRNRRDLIKVSLGVTPIEVINQEIGDACIRGRWILLENMNLLDNEQLRKVIRKINTELERTTSENCKIWITYYMTTSLYSSFWIPEDRRFILEPFCKTCFKSFLNVGDGVKSKIFDFYKLELTEYYAKLEKETSEFDHQMYPDNSMEEVSNSTSIRKELVSGQKIQMHRLSL
mmetsp:Transcript_5710/g.4871  ORF Transcript_5710/g.4871 Transcript_5710/m.4871 type:complete len:255 (-) Transcript_5710:330-1094(-)